MMNLKVIHKYKLIKSNVTIEFYNEQQHNFFVEYMNGSKVELVKLI